MASLVPCNKKSSLLNKRGHEIVEIAKLFAEARVGRRGKEPDVSTVGGRIRTARLAKGLTMEQLAGRIGVTKGAISQWESGTVADLTAANLLNLSNELEVSARWIIVWREKDGTPIPMGMPTHLDADQSDLVETFRILEPEFKDRLIGKAHEYLKLSASQQKPSRANPFPRAVKAKK